MSQAVAAVRQDSQALLGALLSRRWEEELQTLLDARQQSLAALEHSLGRGESLAPGEAEELLELDRRIGEQLQQRRQELLRELHSLRAGPQALHRYGAVATGAFYVDRDA